jgi:predicted nucleotidyltransferase
VTPEQRIVAAAQTRLGRAPVLLCGSRALGAHHPGSDFDVVVVLPVHRIPLALGRLRSLARTLAAELEVPVSINPLPERTLRRRQSLFAWKLRREARVLSPAGFALGEPGELRLTPPATFSYLLTGAFYLLEAIEAAGTGGVVGDGTERSVEKSLLHLAQVRLLREGRYESRLEDALGALAAPDLDAAAESADARAGWLRTRDLLLAEIEALPSCSTGPLGTLVANARYTVLAALRGRLRPAAVLSTTPIDERLARVVVELLRAVQQSGRLDAVDVRRARMLLPATVSRGPDATWASTRDVLFREWPDAHPLSAL